MTWFRFLLVAPFQIFRQCLITGLRCSIVRWCRTGQSIKEQTKRLQARRLCFCCQANVERCSPMVEVWRIVKYVCAARLSESWLRRCWQRRRIPVLVNCKSRRQRRWFDCSIVSSLLLLSCFNDIDRIRQSTRNVHKAVSHSSPMMRSGQNTRKSSVVQSSTGISGKSVRGSRHRTWQFVR